MRPTLALASLASCVLVAGVAWSQDAPRADLAEINALILQLGDDRWKVREEASRKLEEIGQPALPALRKAESEGELEVSTRAARIIKVITDREPERLKALRNEVEEAFRQGLYEKMIPASDKIIVSEDADLLDWLWRGHAHQLCGDWKKAVLAYQDATKYLSARIAKASETDEADPAKNDAHPPMDLLQQRATLNGLIGKIQRDELKDSPAACATFAAAAKEIPSAPWAQPLEYFRLELLRELAYTQEQCGQVAEALATWALINEVGGRLRHRPDRYTGYDMTIVARLFGKLPEDKPMPATGGISVLPADKPEIVLKLADTGTRELSYHPPSTEPVGGPKLEWWYFAVFPPAGKEFDTVTFDVDVEQHTTGTPAHMYITARAPSDNDSPFIYIDGIGWEQGAPPGRKTLTASRKIPPAGGGVFLQTACTKDATVHSIAMKAALRPRQEPKPAPPGVRMQTLLLPPGGTLTCDSKPLSAGPELIHTRISAAAHHLEYQFPQRQRKFTCDVDMRQGGEYFVFANLDSPFDYAVTDLRNLGDWMFWMKRRASLVQRPYGTWLLAYNTGDQRIMLTGSKDLVTWEEPRPLPFNSVFGNIASSLLVDAKGTIHLAYFSNRLRVRGMTKDAGFGLWVTSSTDGREWKRPRFVAVGSVDSSMLDPVQMIQSPGGACWMFWRNMVASADSIDEIRELSPISISKLAQMSEMHAAFDDAGKMHMVYDSGGDIFYCRYDGGWGTPAVLLKRPRNKPIYRPQLVIGPSGACLIHEAEDGAFCYPVTLGETPELGPSVQIASNRAPLNGMKVARTADGQAVLLAGAETVWLLRARLDDLLRAQPPATQPHAAGSPAGK